MCYVLCFNVLLQCCTYTYPHTIPHIKQAALIIICPWRKKIAWQTQKTAFILVVVLNQHQHLTLSALFVDLSNISDSVDIDNTVLLSETSIQYRSFEVTSLKVLDAGVRA